MLQTRRTTPFRRIAFIVVPLLLGAMTTFAVGWACAWSGVCTVIWPDPSLMEVGTLDYDANKPPGWPSSASSNDDRKPHIDIWRWKRPGCQFYATTFYYASRGSMMADRRIRIEQVVRSGWPLFALRASGVRDLIAPAFGPWTPTNRWSGAIAWPQQPATVPNSHWTGIGLLAGEHALPYFVEPIGLLADTALYAVSFWLLIYAFAAIRRWRRRWRGQCAACAYDLRGLPSASICPECGTPSRRRRTTSPPA